MNKIIICTIALFFTLSCNIAMATLAGSKHDLSALGNGPCSYCHTVHNALGTALRPSYLGGDATILQVYSSLTLDNKMNLATANQSDAPLCLTCHDGASLIAQGTSIATDIYNNYINGTAKDLTRDLSNDHPVGFRFNPAIDPELQAPTAPEIFAQFGPGGDEIWCSTCHDPHGAGVPDTKFLVFSNATSGLCLQCHIK